MAGKEYTTAPILVNADGHPIPQYLDITDTTDSPQGTFKPLTQLQAEHPDVQNVQLTGRNVLLSFVTGVNVSSGGLFVAIGPTLAENISGIYVSVRADARHKYRISLDYHREKTSEFFSSYTGGVNVLESDERQYGVSEIIKPIGYGFAILIRNESEEDHIYDLEVRSE